MLSRRSVLKGLLGGLAGGACVAAAGEDKQSKQSLKAYETMLSASVMTLDEARRLAQIPPKPPGEWALAGVDGVYKWLPLTKCE